MRDSPQPNYYKDDKENGGKFAQNGEVDTANKINDKAVVEANGADRNNAVESEKKQVDMIGKADITESSRSFRDIIKAVPSWQSAITRTVTVDSYAKCGSLVAEMVASQLKGTSFTDGEIRVAGLLLAAFDFYYKKQISKGISPKVFESASKRYHAEFMSNNSVAFQKYAKDCVLLHNSILMESLKK